MIDVESAPINRDDRLLRSIMDRFVCLGSRVMRVLGFAFVVSAQKSFDLLHIVTFVCFPPARVNSSLNIMIVLKTLCVSGPGKVRYVR